MNESETPRCPPSEETLEKESNGMQGDPASWRV